RARVAIARTVAQRVDGDEVGAGVLEENPPASVDDHIDPGPKDVLAGNGRRDEIGRAGIENDEERPRAKRVRIGAVEGAARIESQVSRERDARGEGFRIAFVDGGRRACEGDILRRARRSGLKASRDPRVDLRGELVAADRNGWSTTDAASRGKASALHRPADARVDVEVDLEVVEGPRRGGDLLVGHVAEVEALLGKRRSPIDLFEPVVAPDVRRVAVLAARVERDRVAEAVE